MTIPLQGFMPFGRGTHLVPRSLHPVTIPLQGFMPFGLEAWWPSRPWWLRDNPSAGIHAFRTFGVATWRGIAYLVTIPLQGFMPFGPDASERGAGSARQL